jgi:hypothetical protein
MEERRNQYDWPSWEKLNADSTHALRYFVRDWISGLDGSSRGSYSSAFPRLRAQGGTCDPGSSYALSSAVDCALCARGTPLRDQEIRVRRVGQPAHARIEEPVYAFDHLVIPVGWLVSGQVTKIWGDLRRQAYDRCAGCRLQL